jgi:hypothetical protein
MAIPFSSAREIVQHYLILKGFEGLSFVDQCCCTSGNLMNCVGKKDRMCFVDSCEPCKDMKDAAQKIIDGQSIQLHPEEQRAAITAMAASIEPEFVW